MSTAALNQDLLDLGLHQIERYLNELLDESEEEHGEARFVERYAPYHTHTCWCKENSIFDEPLFVFPDFEELRRAASQKIKSVQPVYAWAPNYYWVALEGPPACVCDLHCAFVFHYYYF